MSQSKVSVQSVSKSFYTKEGMTIDALQDVSFDVYERELVCVVGPNGCGKTTLLRIVAGLENPTTGRVVIDGEEAKAGKAGLVFQEFSLFPWRTVIDNVRFGLEVRGIEESESLKVAQRYIDLVGLSKFERTFPYELSEGMKQKVAIARAFATNPTVLLMDEPFAFLDAQTRNFMQEEFLLMWERERKTVLFVSHNVDEATYLADRVVVLSARPGRVKAVQDIGLGRPRTRTSQPFVIKREEVLKLLQEEVRPL